MASTTMTVKLADLAQVQRLVVAAAGALDGIDVERLRSRGRHPRFTDPIRSAALLELLSALEALTPETVKEKAS